MPTTPAERKALLFLGAVAVLGVGVRVVGHVRGDRPAVVGMQPELERQLARAEAQARIDKAEREAREKRGGGRARGRRDSSAAKARGAKQTPAAKTPAALPAPPAIVDVDRADTLALATLPGVGPALARRIVEDRRARGAFGGLAALDGVSGIGPALLQRLAPRVTFSGPPRPFVGQEKPDVQGRRTGTGTRRRAREGARR